MKRIRFLLFALIFMSIAAKVSVTPIEMEYPALSLESRPEKTDSFFEYKINPVQSQNSSYQDKCRRAARCCSA